MDNRLHAPVAVLTTAVPAVSITALLTATVSTAPAIVPTAAAIAPTPAAIVPTAAAIVPTAAVIVPTAAAKVPTAAATGLVMKLGVAVLASTAAAAALAIL